VDEYYSNDRVLSSFDYDDNVYVKPLEAIWYSWLKNFQLREPFLPQHGPGATADCGKKHPRSRKWSSLAWDSVARVCFRLSSLEVALDLPVRPMTRTAKVRFVPKQAGKDRTICMEPAWLMYLQKGVASQLMKYTQGEKHPLSLLINFRSQDVNRRLCASAYQLGYATIDLTNASDSVSWRLIKRLCRRIPLLRYLYGSRSSATVLDGYTSTFDKFAPMGSALCFPIESILFASVVELAHRIHYGQASSGHFSGCSVYGDDIIVPAELNQLVVDILESLGFSVNTMKSYSSGGYYESCGVEYLHGVRINTIRHPRCLLGVTGQVSPEHIDKIIDMSNSLLQFGCFTARRRLLKFYSNEHLTYGNRTVPFLDLVVFDDRHCVPVIDTYRKGRYIKRWQRSFTTYWALEPVTDKSSCDFQQWKSQNCPRPRQQRLAHANGYEKLEFHYQRLNCLPHARWTPKGVTFLSRFQHWDLLFEGDVKQAGSCRTGRFHYEWRKKFLPS